MKSLRESTRIDHSCARFFFSNGLKDEHDIAKCIALGDMAGQFLKAAAVSTEKAVEMMKLTKRQIEVTMFAARAETLEGLKAGKLANKSS